MATSLDECDILQAIRAYATKLHSTLQVQLGVLTTSGSIDRSVYQKARLEPYDEPKVTEWMYERTEITSSPSRPEDSVFENWRQSGFNQPLLIVAPAGAGKSCLLESFALKMALPLMSCETLHGDRLAVPLIVSLAKAGDTPLADYIPLAEQDFPNCELPRQDPSLTPAVLKYLVNTRRLILFIDGFDELPSSHERLITDLSVLRLPFILTSRPGNGERRVVADPERQLTLAELSQAQARQYVRQYFSLRRCKISPNKSITLLDKSWYGQIGLLMSRPLYLKAWCDWLYETLSVPRSIRDFGDQLLWTCLQSRGLLVGLKHANRALALDSFMNWFGILAVQFSLSNFRPHSLAELTAGGLLTETRFRISDLHVDCCELACRSDLLLYSASAGQYRIPKTPISEYVIARALSQDVVHNPTSPRQLVGAFQQLIWSPHLHEILDCTFRLLWSSGQSQRQWASALLEWASRTVPEHYASGLPPNDTVTHDMVFPFVFAALRWHLLNEDPSREEVIQFTNAIDACIRRNLSQPYSPTSFMHLSWPVDRVESLIRKLVADESWGYSQFGRKAHHWTILPGPDPARTVTTLIENGELARGGTARHLWWWPVNQVAARVTEGEAMELVDLWSDRSRNAADYDTAVKWLGAMMGAATCVPSHDLATVVNKLIVQYKCVSLKGDEQYHDLWLDAIEVMAARIHDARGHVFVWISHVDASYGLHDVRPWLRAIRGATIRLDDTAAIEVIDLLIQKGALAREVSWSDEIMRLVEIAVELADQEEARGLIAQWIVDSVHLADYREGSRLTRIAASSPVKQVHSSIIRRFVEERSRDRNSRSSPLPADENKSNCDRLLCNGEISSAAYEATRTTGLTIARTDLVDRDGVILQGHCNYAAVFCTEMIFDEALAIAPQQIRESMGRRLPEVGDSMECSPSQAVGEELQDALTDEMIQRIRGTMAKLGGSARKWHDMFVRFVAIGHAFEIGKCSSIASMFDRRGKPLDSVDFGAVPFNGNPATARRAMQDMEKFFGSFDGKDSKGPLFRIGKNTAPIRGLTPYGRECLAVARSMIAHGELFS